MKLKFLRSIQLVLISAVVLAALSAVVAQSKDTPRVWEAPLVIPTYELNPPNPYPALLDWQSRKWRPVYPYPFLDSLGNQKSNKTCFSPGGLSDAELNALSDHQGNLLKTDVNDIKAWVNGTKSMVLRLFETLDNGLKLMTPPEKLLLRFRACFCVVHT